MRTTSRVLLLAGLACVTLLVAWRGVGTIASLLVEANWRLLLLAALALPNLILCAASWRLLFPFGRAPSFGRMLHWLWIGTSVNALLPVASVGGEVVRARLLALDNRAVSDAVASVVVDKTVMVSTLPLSALLGAVLLLHWGTGGTTVTGVLVGAAAMAGALVLVVQLQRAGAIAFLVRRVVGEGREASRQLVNGASSIDERVRALYGRHLHITAAITIRFAARLLLAVEIWLAAHWIGYPVGIVEAIVLGCLGHAVRGAAFAVPAGLGVQEGTFMVTGALVGLPPEASLSLSLASRVREIIPSIPGLVAWQVSEGRALLQGTPSDRTLSGTKQ